MRGRTLVVCALCLLSFCVGCAPAVRSTVFLDLPPQHDDHLIRIFLNQAPICPYDEVGIVSSRQRNKFMSVDEVMKALRQRAREMGGDAVIGLSEFSEAWGAVVSGSFVAVDHDPVLSGTVIRFKDPGCRD